MKKKRIVCVMLAGLLTASLLFPAGLAQAVDTQTAIGDATGFETTEEDGNVLLFDCGNGEVKVEFCTARTVRVQLSANGSGNYRPDDPEYYMVQKNDWPLVEKTVTQDGDTLRITTEAMEVRIQKSPFRIAMYDLEGNLLSKDRDDQGMYWDSTGIVGVRKTEGTQNAGGIFGFGSGDHGRRSALNRYAVDFSEFTMSHGRLVSPFFMSTVGYGVFLNTLETQTTFYKQGGGFQTKNYLDYYFMYGPDFKTILNEYAEITGRMELYGKWALGFMLSKYGNDNATQAEFLEWLHTLREEGYPCDAYVFDYGWRGDVADNGGNQTGAGQKFGKLMWSNDTVKFPSLSEMFAEADALGFHVGLHNNAGTPEASGGKQLYNSSIAAAWVNAHMQVISAGFGDFFWPDEFDVLGSNSAPVFAAKSVYEAWQAYTDQSRPMFMTRGSYAGQHFATAWSGDIEPTSTELRNQIGYSIDAGLVGYWAVSHDLGGFMSRPTDALYTRWVAEFGAWNGIMRTHGHDGREPWTYDEMAQETLKENLQIRYALYPYTYSLAWQGYSQGVPIMRAMLLEDGSQYNPDAWNLNQQYYYGDWFLVAPAADTNATTVSVWLPPETTWYDYATGERYEGGPSGKTITVAADLDEIPVFVKAGAIVPMGPDVNYADEKPLDPLTLDIYPAQGTTTFTLYEDDGETREYITQEAYSTTEYESTLSGQDLTFTIQARQDHNAAVYQPDARSYHLKFNHVVGAGSIQINGQAVTAAATLEAYNAAGQAYYVDAEAQILYVKTPDTGAQTVVQLLDSEIQEPELGQENQGVPPTVIRDGDRYELEDAEMVSVPGGQVILDTEWKGYTGTGFAKGFKAVGDYLTFQVNIQQAGDYNLVLRVNCGIKNDAQYDFAPRTGTLYVDDTAYPQSFELTPTWGTSDKQGDWRDYTTENVSLTAGVHTITFKIEEGVNPGNFNLDSLTFQRIDRSVDGFSPIQGESASQITGGVILEDADAEEGQLLAMDSDCAIQYAEIRGEEKDALIARVRSTDGGNIIVYENGVGDKVLTTLSVPADGAWHTLVVSSRDTDAVTSDIWFEFTGRTENAVCQLDWWRFVHSTTAYRVTQAETATVRQGVNLRDGKLVNIESGDWVCYQDVDFGESGAAKFTVYAACGPSGSPGICQVYLDASDGQKIAEVSISATGSWDVLQGFTTDCIRATGIHDVYLVFTSDSTLSICDMDWFSFTALTLADYTQVDAALNRVPSDLSGYTAESVQILNDVVAAVERGRLEEEQAAVDAWAQAILDAVAALEPLAPEILLGDMNGDGKLSVTDVVLLRKAILQNSTAADAPAGDMNGDGSLSVTDVVLLRKQILNQA